MLLLVDAYIEPFGNCLTQPRAVKLLHTNK